MRIEARAAARAMKYGMLSEAKTMGLPPRGEGVSSKKQQAQRAISAPES